MGRFDVLTQLDQKEAPVNKLGNAPVAPSQMQSPPLEEQQETVPNTQLPKGSSPVLDIPQPQTGKKQSANGKKPASMQTGKSINALQLKQDKFDKYSTYLRPGYKKELKSIALERDCKDYEVLDEALTLFFEARKK
jgi:hypothetical protein